MSCEGLEKLDELDRLLNDPDVPMQPWRVWALAAEIAEAGIAEAGGGSAAYAPDRRSSLVSRSVRSSSSSEVGTA